MFCKSCGRAVEEGHAFCKNCGAPIPGGAVAGEVKPPPAEAVTEVRPPSPPQPLEPPGPRVVPGYGPGWQPPQAPSAQKSTGLIFGIAAAAIIVLAGIGVGVYFGFFRGDGETSAATGGTLTTRTTAGGSSETTEGSTSSSASSGGGPGTTGDGGNTVQTIPSLDTSTTQESTATSRSTNTTTGDLYGPYLAASGALAAELVYDDERIPELATEINKSLPDVPVWVRDELQALLDTLGDLDWELSTMSVPVEFEASLSWLEEAVVHMVARIQATILGIEAMWDTGRAAASTSYFNTGREERDAYREAFDRYEETLPAE